MTKVTKMRWQGKGPATKTDSERKSGRPEKSLTKAVKAAIFMFRLAFGKALLRRSGAGMTLYTSRREFQHE